MEVLFGWARERSSMVEMVVVVIGGNFILSGFQKKGETMKWWEARSFMLSYYYCLPCLYIASINVSCGSELLCVVASGLN